VLLFVLFEIGRAGAGGRVGEVSRVLLVIVAIYLTHETTTDKQYPGYLANPPAGTSPADLEKYKHGAGGRVGEVSRVLLVSRGFVCEIYRYNVRLTLEARSELASKVSRTL
jgi:hypothetical protein